MSRLVPMAGAAAIVAAAIGGAGWHLTHQIRPQLSIATPAFVNAAGPLVGEVGRLLRLDLPVFSELHLKMALEDRLGIIPREAPLVIWEDEQQLPWTDDEREALAESDETRYLLDPFPGGVHFRPEGGHGAETVLMLWAYHLEPLAPRFPVPIDPDFPEIALRGMSTLVPGLAAYLEKLPKSYVDGGYYTKTQENRPLIGPLPVAGAHIFAALSGYGLMAACAGGELLAASSRRRHGRAGGLACRPRPA